MDRFIQKFLLIENTIAQEKGPVDLFALFKIVEIPNRWEVVISAERLSENNIKAMEYVTHKIRAVLTQKEMITISAVILLTANEPFIEELQKFLKTNNNSNVFSEVNIHGVEIKKGYIIKISLPMMEQSDGVI
ncbi:hypothetical protein [Candidatus Parabeggiatoa sp. HSG14]|uniref:hypothetical protein n=1 Tax=Candidatus Parabeggiatoa sp. HSG14 TaxID=3055593 RepID=UPI0025A91F76|nr:hypothetical protein [Thiotrichales bacterium HSG14]